MTSKHWEVDRKKRNDLIKKIGEGTIVKTVILDRGHKNGAEIHEISSTGIITIKNFTSGKMITKLIARPNQIRRYFPEGEAPKDLIKISKKHMKMGYNMV